MGLPNRTNKAPTTGFVLLFLAFFGFTQQRLPLYPQGIPNAKVAENLEHNELNKMVDANIGLRPGCIFMPRVSMASLPHHRLMNDSADACIGWSNSDL